MSIVLATAIMACTGWQDQALRDEAMQRVLTARHSRLQNIAVNFVQTNIRRSVDPPGDGGDRRQIDDKFGAGAVIVRLSGEESFVETFRLNDDVLWTERIQETFEMTGDHPDTPELAKPYQHVRCYMPERMEEYTRLKPDDRPLGTIRSSGRLPLDEFVDCGLGLRLASDVEGFISAAEFEDYEIVKRGGDAVVVEYRDSHRIRHRWSYDVGGGYAMLRYALRRNDQDYDALVIECGDFKTVEGLRLPFRMERRISVVHPSTGDVVVREKNIIEIEKYEIGAFAHPNEIKGIDWPPDARIYDARRGVSIERQEDGTIRAPDVRMAIGRSGSGLASGVSDVRPREPGMSRRVMLFCAIISALCSAVISIWEWRQRGS